MPAARRANHRFSTMRGGHQVAVRIADALGRLKDRQLVTAIARQSWILEQVESGRSFVGCGNHQVEIAIAVVVDGNGDRPQANGQVGHQLGLVMLEWNELGRVASRLVAL